MIEYITKRNGDTQPFAPEKINNWGIWACEGAEGVSWSDIVTSAVKRGHNGMTTADLQRAMIDSCVDMIRKNPEYDKVAARLFLADLRKRVFGQYQPPAFQEFYANMVEQGWWEDMGYTAEQIDMFAEVIDHERDMLFPYSGLRQHSDKYLLRNIVSGELYETPQFLYMGVAMMGMAGEPIEDVIGFYNDLSQLKVNIPTPILLGCRTPVKGFASCCVISAGDSVDSLDTAEHIAYKMTANRAGIGIELETRAANEPVRGGLIQHQGKMEYYRWIDRAVKANKQQSRGGSATMQYCIFDPEIRTLLRLRSQRIAEKDRIDTMDYSLAINNYFLRKLVRGEKIALISPLYAPNAHKLFYSKDMDAFIEAYEAEVRQWKNRKVIKTREGMKSPVSFVDAEEIFKIFAQQRGDTGRIYCHRVDEANIRSTFKDPIRTSNLCLEIELPTAPFRHVTELYGMLETAGAYHPAPNLDDITGEVALCNLGGIVINRIADDVEYEQVAYRLIKFIDNIIEIQIYPFPAMEHSAKNRRSIGVGIINLAHALAERGLSYASNEGRTYMHQQAERMSYFLHRASIRLAQEKGQCGWWDRTTYSEGTLMIDNANKEVDKFHNAELEYDWESVRKDILTYGMRNSVLEAYMPSESSSVTIGCTNGVEPIRMPLIFKSSRQGDVAQLAPDWTKLQFDYEMAFDIPSDEYIKSMAVLQKFVGQSISFNVYYDVNKYPNGMVPLNTVMKDFLLACKLGIKTFYYHNSEVQNGGSAHDCAGCQV